MRVHDGWMDGWGHGTAPPPARRPGRPSSKVRLSLQTAECTAVHRTATETPRPSSLLIDLPCAPSCPHAMPCSAATRMLRCILAHQLGRSPLHRHDGQTVVVLPSWPPPRRPPLTLPSGWAASPATLPRPTSVALFRCALGRMILTRERATHSAQGRTGKHISGTQSTSTARDTQDNAALRLTRPSQGGLPFSPPHDHSLLALSDYSDARQENRNRLSVR